MQLSSLNCRARGREGGWEGGGRGDQQVGTESGLLLTCSGVGCGGLGWGGQGLFPSSWIRNETDNFGSKLAGALKECMQVIKGRLLLALSVCVSEFVCVCVGGGGGGGRGICV